MANKDLLMKQLEQAQKEQDEYKYTQWQSSSASVVPAREAEPKKETFLGNFSWLSMMQDDPTSANNLDAFNGMEGIAQSVTDYAKGSNAYYKYLASDEEKQSEAKRVSIETGIPVNALLMSDENLALGRSVQEYRRKKMAFALDGESDFDLSGVYEKFPGLQAIVENPNMSENDVAIAMHNIEDLTKTKTVAEVFSLGLEADKANYRIGEIGMLEFLGGEITPELRKEIETLKKSIPEQKAMPNFFDDPLTVIAGGTGANIYHMEHGFRRGAQMATTALATGVGVSVASGGTLAAPAMTAAMTAAGVGVRWGMVYDMFLNSAGRHYNEYSEMKQQDGRPLLKKSEARTFAAIAAGLETGVEFWNYDKIMNLLGASYKRDILAIVAKANGNQNLTKAGLRDFIKERSSAAAKAVMTETAEEAVQDISDKAVHNAIITYAPHAAERKYTGTEFVRGALEASAEALPGIIGLGVLGGAASNIKSVRDFARLQKEQSDIFFAEAKLANGLGMIKSLQENMADSKLFKKNPDIYQAVVKSAVENTEFKEVRVDTELALEDEAGAQVFNQLTDAMGLEQEEVNAIIENKADLIVPTEIYAQTVMENDAFDRYISFDEKGHSIARKKYYMAVAEDMAKNINIEQEEQQAELIDGIITANFPEAGIEQDLGVAVILTNPANPKQAWTQMKRDITDSIDARLGGIVKRLEEGMSRGVHYYYSEDSGYAVKRQSDNDQWYGDFYKEHKRKPNKAELREMAREVYKGGGEKYGMPEYTFEVTEDMQSDFDSLDNAFEEMYALDDIKGKIDNLTASEMAVVRSLTPSGYKVYQAARGKFQSGNTDVRKAGRMNAILLARYADRMADKISKTKGEPYTAEDYMRERMYIVADAQNADAQGYGQSVPVESFYTVEVTGKEFGNYRNLSDLRKKAIEWYKNNLQGTVVHNYALGEIIIDQSMAGQDILFGGKGRRKMSSTSAKTEKMLLVKHLKDLAENANFITEAEATDNKHVGEHFYYLHSAIIVNGEKQYVIVTVRKTQEKQLLYYNHNVYTQNEYKKIEGRLQETLGSRSSSPNQHSQEAPSVNNSIPDDGEVFNKQKIFYQAYNQTAYHGSPHKFDTFDLGAIGSGEGAQAHGWGLYFAQDRKIANNYRVDLAGASYTLNGKDLNDVYRDLERERKWDKLAVLEDFMIKQDITEMDVDDYDSSAWKWFKQIYPQIKGEGSLFEVDIPDSDVLLDEDKPLSEQPLKVRKAILEFYRQRPEDFIAPKSENDLGASGGSQFYREVVFQMRREGDEESSERAASETLNALGIKGITYYGSRDGRCYVVFDDKAISVIERYNQSVRGQTKISAMSRVVSLFENADKSTFVHELGHVALADLKMLAEMEGAPAQVVKDWQTVKEWLGYKDKQGFTQEQHEKFARGFEAYLRTGEAPVRGLKAVFRTFKKWLCDIYADFVQLGGKPSPEVQAVMARMLASEQEIEAEAKIQGIESITKKKGMQILDDSTQAMCERWVAEAKEEAKEKVMKIAMQDVSDRFEEERKEIIDSMRENIENELKEKDIFRAEECVRVSKSMDILPMLGYTEESYRSELKANGGSLQKAVEEELTKAVADLDSNKVSDEQIRIEAEKALSSSEYKAMILTMEYEALARKEENEKRLDKTVTKALDDIEKDLRGDTDETKNESAQVKSLKQKIADLKYTYRWREAEMKLIEQMQKAEAKEEKQRAVDALRAELRAEIAKSNEGIRLVRDAVEGQLLIYRQAAKENIAKLPIRQATATYSWRQKERMKGTEVARLMAKGKWKEAKEAKLEQVTYSYLADESSKLKEKIEIQIRKLKKRSRSINKGNTKMDAEGRYFYNHLLYVFGINRQDAPMPTGWESSGDIEALFKRYVEEYNLYVADEDKKDDEGKVDIPRFIRDAVSRRDVYREQVDIIGRRNPVSAIGYGALTKDEWDELLDVLSSIYTISNNADRLYTVVDENGDAVSFDDAVKRITEGIRTNSRIKKNKDTTGATEQGWIERQVTAAGDLSSELIKPETIFLQNDGGKDGASMMFLYDPLKRASDKEIAMKTKSTKAVKDMFSKHGMKDWKKKQYKFGTSTVTKEQVIVIALNWGNEINRKRIMDGYHVTEQEVRETLSELDENDWDLVAALWEHIDSFWDETVAVEERMTGVGIKKQEATPFDVTGKNGNVYHIKGGYYPIMYDPDKSIRAADQAQNDVAKQQMSDNAVLGTGRGHTKARSQETIERQVYTTFKPLSKALDNVIHNICYREAVRDVNKLLNNNEVVKAMQEAHGMKVVRDLQKWVRDNWAMDDKKDGFSRAAAFLRRNMTMAVMGYRVSTALLNVTNIFPMMEYIGIGRTLRAILGFAQAPQKTWEDCIERSVFLAERAQTMDRDVREKINARNYTTQGKIISAVNDHAFTLMAWTDLVFAVPLWKSEYVRVWQEQSAEGIRPEVIEQQAVAAGDAAVRRVFGSGDVKDLAPVQRGSEVAKGLTMYYSYMNTVYNALVLKGAIAKDKRSREAWMNFTKSILYWCVLTKISEEVIRTILSDDEDDLSKRVGKVFTGEKMAQSLGEQVTGMFPIARDIYKAVVDVIADGRAYNPNYTSAYDSIARAVRAAQTIRSKKTDLVDVGREVTREVNTVTGWSDTLTDGFWTLLRIANRDVDTDIGEALKAIVFDKKLKKDR